MTTSEDSTPNKEPSGAEKLIGDFAPKLVELITVGSWGSGLPLHGWNLSLPDG